MEVVLLEQEQYYVDEKGCYTEDRRKPHPLLDYRVGQLEHGHATLLTSVTSLAASVQQLVFKMDECPKYKERSDTLVVTVAQHQEYLLGLKKNISVLSTATILALVGAFFALILK